MLKIYIEQPVWARVTQIFILDEQQDGSRSSFVCNAEGVLVREPLSDYANPKPAFTIHGYTSKVFCDALSEALVQAGHRPDTTFEAGQLVATKEHLHDMRMLAGVVDRFVVGGVKT